MHATWEAQELVQHTNWEAREDHHNAMQPFEGWFRTVKLEEMLQLLDLMSQDDLPECLHALGCNKKNLDDALVLEMAIDNWAASPVSTADEYTKLDYQCILYLCLGCNQQAGNGWHHPI